MLTPPRSGSKQRLQVPKNDARTVAPRQNEPIPSSGLYGARSLRRSVSVWRLVHERQRMASAAREHPHRASERSTSLIARAICPMCRRLRNITHLHSHGRATIAPARRHGASSPAFAALRHPLPQATAAGRREEERSAFSHFPFQIHIFGLLSQICHVAPHMSRVRWR